VEQIGDAPRLDGGPCRGLPVGSRHHAHTGRRVGGLARPGHGGSARSRRRVR